MGPPTLVDGDAVLEILRKRIPAVLQWGRRLSSTETLVGFA